MAPTGAVVNQAGSATDDGWAGEEALDAEWAHAIAPGTKILIVEAASQDFQALLNAVSLAPQVATLRFSAADACEARGDYDMAIALLQPMVNDPHSPGTSRGAQERIEELQKRKAEAKPAH